MKAGIHRLCLAILLAGAGAIQAQELAALQIEACHVNFTELGKLASFKFSVVYALQSGESGAITTVSVAPQQQERRNRLATFVQLGQLEKCFRRWRLRPQTQYLVRFEAGTTGDRICTWLLSLCHNGSECIEVRLPRP